MTEQELRIKQSLDLESKIYKFENDIQKFIREVGQSYYVTFSGGKDSSVGLHLIQQLVLKGIIKQPRVVFSNTGQEYKGIVENVHKTAKKYGIQIDIVKPKIYKELQDKGLYPTDLWREVGFPVVTKQVSMAISRYRVARDKVRAIIKTGRERKLTEKEIEKLRLLREVMRGRLFGIKRKNSDNRGYLGIIPVKWRHFINKPYKISNKCCDHLKKEPMDTYKKENNLLGAVVFTRVDESLARKEAWLKSGCTVVDHDKEIYLSKPLSIWTSKDIDDYIELYGIELSREYTEMGMKRTGCRACPFGCHLEPTQSDNRYQINHKFYPKEWEHDMKYMGMGTIVEDMGVSYDKDYSIEKGQKKYKLF